MKASTKARKVPEKAQEDHRCDRCGGFGGMPFGEEFYCAECYNVRDSCCPEFGADDLWARDDEEEK